MCLTPITKRITDSHGKVKVVTFPCGHCVECVAKYQNDWKFRLYDEFKRWPYAYFCTITYDNENIPTVSVDLENRDRERKFIAHFLSQHINEFKNRYMYSNDNFYDYLFAERVDQSIDVPVCYKKDIQNYIKKIREQYFNDFGSRLNMKYFICSEYGPNTFRPHYHAIFYTDTCSPEYFLSLLSQKWTFGNVQGAHRITVNQGDKDEMACFAYVAKYCCKPAQFESPYVTTKIAVKPFRMISKGIGSARRISLKKEFDRLYSLFIQEKIKKDNEFFDVTSHSDNTEFGGFLDENDEIQNSEIARNFCDSVKHIFSYTSNGYVYRLPRYWIDYCFPKKIKSSVCFKKLDKNGKAIYTTRKCVRKDSESYLSNLYKSFIQYESSQLWSQQYQELARVNPSWTDEQICRALSAMDVESLREREQKKLQSLAKYYTKNSVKKSY